MAKIYTKDRASFMKHYDEIKERVFYREVENDKVEVKIALPCYQKEVKEVLNKIKD